MPRKRLLASMAVHFDLMLTFAVSAILSTGEENNELIKKQKSNVQQVAQISPLGNRQRTNSVSNGSTVPQNMQQRSAPK